MIAVVDLRRIVEFVGVGQVHQLVRFRIHQVRLVVVDPVRDIAATFLGEDIQRVPGFRQRRPQPAGRFAAGGLFKFGQ